MAMTTHNGTERGFAPLEFFYGLLKHNLILCPVTPNLNSIWNDKEVIIDFTKDFEALKKDLLILGKTKSGGKHALVYCSYANRYYDPNGLITEDLTLLPEAMYVLFRNHQEDIARS